MKSKVLSIVLVLSISILFSGCSCTTEYIEVPVEVKVPVKCKVELPDGEINESLNESEKLVEMLKYIANLHRNIERCK
jgi:hypothetical protein